MLEPLISIVTPVYNPDADVLRECIASVTRQSYSRWQLCLVDDASPASHVWPMLSDAAAGDDRIIVRRRSENGGIVAASNDAVALATGEVVVLLDHDDMLHPQALREVATQFNDHDDLDYLYTDEDLVDQQGRRVNPFFKPDWSPERFRNQMYTCHLSAIRTSLGEEVGWFREGFDGAQDWDLMLRVTEKARRIVHIPKVLYHWRVVATSVLAGDDVKPYAYESAKRAIEGHVARTGIPGSVVELGRRGHFRVKRSVIGEPLVSIVIPTCGSSGRAWGDQRVMVVEAVRAIVERSTWSHFEILVVADSHTPPGVLGALHEIAGSRLTVVPFEGPFDFSAKCNTGALHAKGEVLTFLNDDTEIIDDDWMETMLGFVQEPEVGAVGCELRFPDGTLQHAGHVFIGGNPGHLMFGRAPRDEANRLALWLDREVSGVTAAALMCRAAVFDEVGGFSLLFPGNYQDVDFNMKVRRLGYRVVVTPWARMYHFESVSRDPTVRPGELELLRERWWHELHHDPYYNPNHAPGLDGYPVPVTYP